MPTRLCQSQGQQLNGKGAQGENHHELRPRPTPCNKKQFMAGQGKVRHVI